MFILTLQRLKISIKRFVYKRGGGGEVQGGLLRHVDHTVNLLVEFD